MALLPLRIPPGVRRAGTEYLSQGRWYDANLMRWYEGAMLPVGGWAKVTASGSNIQLTGTPNCVIQWRANDSTIWTAFGTNSKIYAYNASTLTDITPAAGYTPGTPGSVGTSPYGSGLWGVGAFSAGESVASTPGSTTAGITVTESSIWQLDTFGEILLGVMSGDGNLWYWDLNTANNMALADSVNAPIDNIGVVVTPERFVMLLGAGGVPRKVQWADQEVYNDWTGTAQGGDFQLETPHRLVAGLRLPRETLLFTDGDVHSAIYIGGTLIYSFERRGTACGLISVHAKANVGDGAFWMSSNGFFQYDGTVNQLPCEVHDYVFSDIDTSQSRKIWAVANTRFQEVWWFYPSLSSGSGQIDRYVVYNYRERHWTIGQLNRTAGIDRTATGYPIWCDKDGYVYEHERGLQRDSTKAYARSGPVEIGNGDNVYMVRRVVPDEQTQGEVKLTMYTRLPGPLGTEYTHGPYTIASPTSVRFTGRQVAVKIEETTANSDFRVGLLRADGVLAGER